MMRYLQRLGKSLMLPVAALPVAAILLGIGYAIDPNGWGGDSQIAAFLIKSGGALIDNMGWLFALGVAIGMSDDQDGAAALSGLVSFLVITTLLSSGAVSQLLKIPAEEVSAAFGNRPIHSQFIGILAGLIGAACYNKFKNTKLPTALAFFSGKRSVAIVTSVVSMIVAMILLFVWPFIYEALVAFGVSIMSLGAVGAGIYGFFNRLLIPFGLHHALNSVFWFDVAGINDIGRFLGPVADAYNGIPDAVKSSYHVGMYQAGFFPVMMFGLPGAALAMFHTAKTKNKKAAASLLLAAAITSFVTGVTEPLEFSFMFLAPALYLVHAVLTAVSVIIVSALGYTAGFGFSAGVIDFGLSLFNPNAKQPFMLLVIGVIFFAIYYFVFRFMILTLNLKTPGREDDQEAEKTLKLANDDYTAIAKIIMEGIGGSANLTSIDNCITRLRLEIKDYNLIDEKKIKSAGVAGVLRPSKTSLQVIIGPQVQFVADEFKKLK